MLNAPPNMTLKTVAQFALALDMQPRLNLSEISRYAVS
jgi:hypothetical protein